MTACTAILTTTYRTISPLPWHHLHHQIILCHYSLLSSLESHHHHHHHQSLATMTAHYRLSSPIHHTTTINLLLLLTRYLFYHYCHYFHTTDTRISSKTTLFIFPCSPHLHYHLLYSLSPPPHSIPPLLHHHQPGTHRQVPQMIIIQGSEQSLAITSNKDTCKRFRIWMTGVTQLDGWMHCSYAHFTLSGCAFPPSSKPVIRQCKSGTRVL